MATLADDEKKALKAEFKRTERAEARAKMVLSQDQLNELLDHLDEVLEVEPCDHSLRRARAWVMGKQLDADAVSESLRAFGGYCDCEVVANVNPEEIFD